MEWTDDGLLIGVHRHGERGLIANVLTRRHGRCKGYVRSPNKSDRAALQRGNGLHVRWRARLHQQLGAFTIDVTRNRIPLLLSNRTVLLLVNVLCGHLSRIPEHAPYEGALDLAEEAIHRSEVATERSEVATDRFAPLGALLRFEAGLLRAAGFGIDASRCALTGTRDNLRWISPETGRCASEQAGAPWANKLIAMPSTFPQLVSETPARALPVDPADWLQAFSITAHFLEKQVYDTPSQGLPMDRATLLRLCSAKGSPTA